MKHIHLVALAGLTAMLGACGHGNDISIEGRSITLHAAHAPQATITSRGSLSVDNKLIDVDAQQRQLLQRYYLGVVAIHEDTEALRKAGLDMAGQSLKLAGHSIRESLRLAGNGSTATAATQGDIEAAGNAIEHQAKALCTRVHDVRDMQARLSTELAAFAAYATIDAAPGVHCRANSSVAVQ